MYRNFIQHVPDLIQEVDFVGPIKSSKRVYKETIPEGLARLPARLTDPDLMAAGKPTFLRIGEGNEPRNELLRVVNQYPSKDEVRTKVLGEIFPPTDKDPYFARPDNIAAIRTASEQLGIPLERTGLRIATHPFRLEGDVADVNLLAQITKRAAGNLQRQGSPVLANALSRKANFFNQPRSYRELAVDGSEGIDSIIAAYEKAEPRVTANSQGNRPILMQADGLDPNIGIPSGSPKNIPPMDIEGMRGANRFVDVSQGAETARVIQYPNIYDRINKGAQPVVTPTIPYAADLPTGQEFILSPKVSIETKRPRFIGLGSGIYTRTGEPINAEQKNLLDMGMADLEDRSFILKDPIDLVRQPARALASRLPTNYYGVERDIPTGVDAVIRGWGRKNEQGYLQTDLPLNYYGVPRVIPKAKFAEGGMVTPTSYDLPLTDEIGSVIGSQINREQYRPTTRLGLQTLGLNADIGRETITPSVEIGDTLYPSNSTIVRRSIPINRLTDDLSNRVLSGEVGLRNYEPFKSNRNTYGAREGKTPWREYYSDPFVYEDKGMDNEVNRLMKAVNEAPAQLENAYTQQASANRRASDIQDTINVVRRMGRGTTTPQSDVFSLGVSPELMVKPTSLFNSLKKDRRIAEVEASKAADRIAELKAAQELMGVEYMVKPKKWGEDVLSGYRIGSNTIGGVRDSNEIPVNDKFSEEVFDKLTVFQDPLLVEGKPVRRAAKPNGWTIKPNAVQMWREALQQEALDNRRDYDIASTFGFSGNY